MNTKHPLCGSYFVYHGHPWQSAIQGEIVAAGDGMALLKFGRDGGRPEELRLVRLIDIATERSVQGRPAYDLFTDVMEATRVRLAFPYQGYPDDTCPVGRRPHDSEGEEE